MFSASQAFPFPGKLGLKTEMAERDSEYLSLMHEALKRQVVRSVTELYFDLFLAHKGVELIREKTGLFLKIEEAAALRYSTGMGMQQEVTMAQAEKYMLLEKEEMLLQKIRSIEIMLNSLIGKAADSPLGTPEDPGPAPFEYNAEQTVARAYEFSPEIKAKEKMAASAEVKVRMAEKDYYPDFTINAGYAKRGGPFEDMWSVTTSFSIPLFYGSKQRQAVYQAEASYNRALHELEAARVMTASSIRDGFAMIRTSEKLMELYRDGLIPKTMRDFDLALAGYSAGRTDAATVISSVKALSDYQYAYWEKFTEREKAIAKIAASAGPPEKGEAR